MYEQVFNFNSRPFTTTPYVRHYFAASSIHQAIGQASICVERGSGPVIAVGDIGVGKSLFLEMLQSHFQHQLLVVSIACSRDSSRREFLQNILFQLGRPTDAAAEAELRFAIIEAANPSEACPNGILLLVDDAEVLSSEIFDELRLLMNFVVDGAPRIRLVLAGQKSLEDRLARPEIASFSQRIASRVFLQALTREETNCYVVEHIDRVGGAGAAMFPPETNAKLYEVTEGCPRQINQVCDFVLILAGTRGLTSISPQLVQEAWADVQSLPGGGGFKPEAVVADTPSDWTVIEFGQLDDEGGSEQSSAASEFEIQPAGETVFESPTTSLDLTESVDAGAEMETGQPSNEEASSEAGSNEETPTEQPQSTADSDLGIDFAALQAMRDAHANSLATASESGGENKGGDENKDANKSQIENGVSKESKQEVFVPATSPVSATESASNESLLDNNAAGSNAVTEEPKVDSKVGLAPESNPAPVSGIQSELAAVFGSMNFQSQPSTGETEGPAEKLTAEVSPAAELAAEPRADDSRVSEISSFENASQASFVPASDPRGSGFDQAPSVSDDVVVDLESRNVLEESLPADESLVAVDVGVAAADELPVEQGVENDPLADFQASLAQLRAGNQEAWAAASTERAEDLSNQNFAATAESIAAEVADEPNVSFESSVAHASDESNDQANSNAGQIELQQTPDVDSFQPLSQEEQVGSSVDVLGDSDVAGTLDDPFAESFDQVEAVVDRFAPEIAIQNQNALEITSADLKHVHPLVDSHDPGNEPVESPPAVHDLPVLDQLASPSDESVAVNDLGLVGREEISPAGQNVQVNEAAVPVEANQDLEAADSGNSVDSVDSAGGDQIEPVTQTSFAAPSGVNWIKEDRPVDSETSSSSDDLVASSLANELSQLSASDVADASRQETVDEELTAKLNANQPLRGFTINPPSQFQPPRDPTPAGNAADNGNLQFSQAPLAADSDLQDVAQPPDQSASNQAKSGFEFVQPTYELTDREPTKTADPAAAELAPAAETAQDQTNPVREIAASETPAKTETAPAQPQYRQPHVNEATSEEISRQADEILKRLERGNVNAEPSAAAVPVPTAAPRQTEDADSGMEILSEIRDQQQLVASVKVEEDAPGALSINSGDDSNPLPGTVPMVPTGTRADDSEMLFVKQPNESGEDDGSEAAKPSLPFLGEPVSKGRATRMNYEQLFDRLRDLKDND
jgi:type II secretory pathway predicted ATPase ExeA